MEGTRDARRGGLSPIITWKVSPEEKRVQRRRPSSERGAPGSGWRCARLLTIFLSPSLIGCHTGKAHPLQPEINKHAPQFKCHHLLCNTASLCVPVCVCARTRKPPLRDLMRVSTRRCSRVNLCVRVMCRSRVSLAVVCFEINDSGARKPTNTALGERHNGGAELPVDVFEDRSSFFSVSTSLPPHTDALTTQTPHATPALRPLKRRLRSFV